MGKVKTINPEEQEAKAKEAAAKEAERLARIEAAKAEGQAKKLSDAKAMDDKNKEERIKKKENSVIAPLPASGGNGVKQSDTSDEIATSSAKGETPRNDDQTEATEKAEEPKAKKKTSKYAAKQRSKTRERSANYQKAAQLVDKSKLYTTKEALQLLEKAHLATFDETVELHINTASAGISGQVTLPHGTGKNVRVAILQPASNAAAADALLKKIEAGKIDFDILIATPDAMPKLARVAKVLGPKGLMPNPKTGTITSNPETVAKQYEGGQMHYKTEAKTPVMHAAVGKLSFGADKLAQNIETFLRTVKMENIRKVTVKSTMSPGIKLEIGK